MWISNQKYKLIKKIAESNEHDANLWREVIFNLKSGKIIHHSDFVMMPTKDYEAVFKRVYLAEDKCKELEAELQWYKVKYHEMKMNEEKRGELI